MNPSITNTKEHITIDELKYLVKELYKYRISKI